MAFVPQTINKIECVSDRDVSMEREAGIDLMYDVMVTPPFRLPPAHPLNHL